MTRMRRQRRYKTYYATWAHRKPQMQQLSLWARLNPLASTRKNKHNNKGLRKHTARAHVPQQSLYPWIAHAFAPCTGKRMQNEIRRRMPKAKRLTRKASQGSCAKQR